MTDGLDGDFQGTFPFEPRYASVGRVRLHYVDEGPGDSPPVLFVHGNPTWSYLWRRVISELAAEGRRCIAFDHMGFGRSDKPPYLSGYSLQTHIHNALALIDQLDLRNVTLVAHDWGGPIGLGAMLERLDVPVKLVWGMRDRVFQPVFLDQWLELFPEAEVIRVESAAHYVPEDEPGAVVAALRGWPAG